MQVHDSTAYLVKVYVVKSSKVIEYHSPDSASHISSSYIHLVIKQMLYDTPTTPLILQPVAFYALIVHRLAYTIGLVCFCDWLP